QTPHAAALRARTPRRLTHEGLGKRREPHWETAGHRSADTGPRVTGTEESAWARVAPTLPPSSDAGGRTRPGAVGAHTEQFHGVCYAGEAVLGSHLAGPPLDGGPLDLHGCGADPAHQVMVVVLGRTSAVDGLTFVSAQDVDLT